MSYICSSCKRKFENEAVFVQHFLKCWKETNPNHKSKDAPRSSDIISHSGKTDEAIDFFNSFKR